MVTICIMVILTRNLELSAIMVIEKVLSWLYQLETYLCFFSISNKKVYNYLIICSSFFQHILLSEIHCSNYRKIWKTGLFNQQCWISLVFVYSNNQLSHFFHPKFILFARFKWQIKYLFFHRSTASDHWWSVGRWI